MSNLEEFEITAYIEHIRNIFAETNLEKSLDQYFPINIENFFTCFQDGVLLGHLINLVKPGSLEIEKLEIIRNKSTQLESKVEQTKDLYNSNLNLNYVITAAKKSKFVTVNIGAEDFLTHNRDIVLGLIWQIIRHHLTQEINLISHPQLIRLLEKNESILQLTQLTPEQLLIRWVNYHLSKSGCSKRITNFSNDLQDGYLFLELLGRITDLYPVIHKQCQIAKNLTDSTKRISSILFIVEQLKCRKFISAKSILQGNARLNMAFTAVLFNKLMGIYLPDEEDIKKMIQNQQELTIHVEKLDKDLMEKNNQIQKQNGKIDDLNSKLMEAYKSIDNKNVEIEELNRQLKETSDAEQKLKQNIAQTIKGIILNIKPKHNSNNSSINDDSTEISQSLEILDKSIEELNNEMELLRMKLDTLTSKLGKQEYINDVMGEKIKQYSEEISYKNKWTFSPNKHGSKSNKELNR